MRVLLLLSLMLSAGVVSAQVESPQGSYVRYKHLGREGHVKQTLNLKGATTGTYSLDERGGGEDDFTTGYWVRSKIWRHNRDSMNVVILDPENEYETRYLEIEPTGCLTPVDEDGDRRRGANAYMPVWRISYKLR